MEKVLEMTESLELNELHRLVKEERLEAVKHWMKEHADDAHRCGLETTPLILAVQLNNQQIARALLEGFSREDSRRLVNRRRAKSLDGPLHIAAASNSVDIVRLLLSYGANFELRNSANERALNRSSDEAIQFLLRSVEQLFELAVLVGKASNLKIAKDVPLLTNVRIINWALELLVHIYPKFRDFLYSIPAKNAAAIMYARNSEDLTALQYLMINVNVRVINDIVKFRLDKLKRADWRAPGPVDELLLNMKRVNLHLSNLDDRCVENKEPIGDLIKHDVTSILSYALDFLNAYKRLVDGTLSEQPLLIIIGECLEYYCDGKSAFTESERVNKLINAKAPALVGQLLKLCVAAPMRLFMQSVCTAELLHAAEANDLPTLETCLAGAPKLRQRDAAGLAPLHHALRHGNSEMARLLLNFGAADGDGKDDGKETLLHWTVRHMDCSQGVIASGQPQVRTEVVRMILDSRVGADYVDARSSADGSTALHLAVRANNVCNVQLLLSRGAVYCYEDEDDKRPADLCAEESHKIRELLGWCKRLFHLARDGKADELLETAEALDKFTLLAVGGARNVSGLTLDRALELKGHAKAAEEMRLLLDSAGKEQ